MEGGTASGKEKCIVVGLWGGNGGSSWDDGSYNGIREITLAYNQCIDSIRVVYDKYGKPVTAEKHGGSGGNQMHEIKLQYPEEFLTSVSGYYSIMGNTATPIIRSIAFKSNQRAFGPFGVEEGSPFSFSVDGGQIVGFKGRSGLFLDGIGFHLSRLQTTNLRRVPNKKLQKVSSTASKSFGHQR